MPCQASAALRTSLLIAASLLVGLSLLACGGSSDRDGPSDGPSGWVEFSEGAWSGYIRPGWDIVRVDTNNIATEAVLAKIPADSRTSVQQLLRTGSITEMTLVYLDQDPSFATNIYMLGCYSDQDSLAGGGDVVAAYKSIGVPASKFAAVAFEGQELELIKASLNPTNDAYQTFAKVDNCSMAITLATRANDSAPIEDFKTFLSALDVDAKKLPHAK